MHQERQLPYKCELHSGGGGTGMVEIKSVFPDLIDACVAWGVMAEAAAEIGLGLGQAF